MTNATITVKVWISAIAAVSSVPLVAKALTIDGAMTLASTFCAKNVYLRTIDVSSLLVVAKE